MREKVIEKYLCDKVISELRGWPLKFISPGQAGVPDRLIVLPGGRIVFLETKSNGQKLRPLQRYVSNRLRGLGQKVECIDSIAAVDDFIERCKRNGI